ncbi:hypothetical protein FB446DRAFT_848867 [Lentinula raphanica]|nr:hypothetical protein FB446DRAFT_848867 [Lentinula raphanica]
MSSTVLRHPDKIFDTPPPPPPPWSAEVSLSPRTPPSPHWNESRTVLRRVLLRLQTTLRSLHKRKIHWPIESPDSSRNLTPSEYLMMLLQPIPGIFNQLNPTNHFKSPMEFLPVDLGHSICAVSFALKELKLWNLAAPLVVALPGDLFDSTGQVNSNVLCALSLALEHSPAATIIVTNFIDIAIFLPANRDPDSPEPRFERVSSTQPPLALRVIATAFLLAVDIRLRLINAPRPDWIVVQDLVSLQGPPKDPLRLLPDQELFSTHHRQSDFDMVTLVRDPARALQFFRWHEYMTQTVSKVVAHPHDILIAKTNEVGQFDPGSRPIYPFDASELPSDTVAHLETIQRVSPLVAAGIDALFAFSKTFTIEIQGVVDEGSVHGICTVYRCRIVTIDNVPVSTPSLCLKLFDDRFQALQNPEHDNLDDDEVNGDLSWLAPVMFAEKYALNEAFAYEKLLPVQGSVVPWFFGTHRFTTPNGTILYGLLMEFVEGWKLETSLTNELSPDRQINMIRSFRHAVRVLDVADISQRDWHREQFLLCTNPSTNVDHVVLLDFASTLQTWNPDEPIHLMNYFHMFRMLLPRKNNPSHVGLIQELVWDHFGEPDDWDPVMGWIHDRCVEARDMFDYIKSL